MTGVMSQMVKSTAAPLFADSPRARKTSTINHTTQWLNCTIARHNAFMPAVRDIARMASHKEIVSVSIVGSPGSGKTELARTMSCLLHTEMKKSYDHAFAVKECGEAELRDIEHTISNLTGNVILILDDISFLKQRMSARDYAEVQSALTKIRHINSTRDVRIVLVYNYHYTRALDKYSRGTDFAFYTSISHTEIDNVMETVGSRNYAPLMLFRRHKHAAMTKGFWSTKLGKAGVVSYQFHDPFDLALFWSGAANIPVHEVVFPLRERVARRCSICANAKGDARPDIDTNAMWNELEARYGIGCVRSCTKVWLLQQGLNAYASTSKACFKAIDRVTAGSTVDYQALLDRYQLKTGAGVGWNRGEQIMSEDPEFAAKNNA